MINKRLKRVAIPCMAVMSLPAYSNSGLEEVTVTAQKREQSLQDVSVSVSAFSGDTLNELGIHNPKDVGNLMPNVSVRSSENFPTFNIRGVQLLDFGDGNESPISFYIDEVYYGTAAGQTAALFDMERAEVLRGPQGTLFGRNSTGGLVHFITKKPTESLEAHGTLELASDNEVITGGALSGSLAHGVRGRIAIRTHERDGWQTGGAGQELGSVDTWSVRGMLEFDLSDGLTALLTVSASDLDNTSNAASSLGLNDPALPEPAFPGAPPGLVAFRTPCAESAVLSMQCVNTVGIPSSSRDPERPGTTEDLSSEIELFGANLKLTWDLNEDLELVSITAFNSAEKDNISDADASAGPFGLTLNSVESKTFSQEIRLSGSSDTLTWIAGAFYYDDEQDPLEFAVPSLVMAAGGNTFSLNSDAILETTSWAVFGQAEYQLTEELTVVAGLRFTDEQKDLLISNDLDNPSLLPGTTTPFLAEEEIDETEVTGRLGLDWRPTEGTLAYLSITTGYKSGAFNTTFATPEGIAPSESEEVINYEIGVKSSFLDDTLRFNASVFYSDYSDLQGIVIVPGTTSTAVVNIGDADIYGLELEATWLASENVDVIFGMGLLDTKVESENPLFDSNELAFSPPLSANLLVRYQLPFTLAGGELVWTNAVRYLDEHFQEPINGFASEQEEYAVLDTVLRWNSPNSTYFVEAFVKNVGDKEYTVSRYTVEALGVAGSNWERLRHGGIRFGFDF